MPSICFALSTLTGDFILRFFSLGFAFQAFTHSMITTVSAIALSRELMPRRPQVDTPGATPDFLGRDKYRRRLA